MRAERQDVLKRINYIEGHLKGIRKMVEEDQYCVDILRQTYAVRKSIEKLESIILFQRASIAARQKPSLMNSCNSTTWQATANNSWR